MSTDKVVGHFITEYVFNGEKFNQMMDSGCSFEAALNECKKSEYRMRVGSYNAFYRLYEYEVNGTNYIRASRKATHRRDRGIAISERIGINYEVVFDADNPSNSNITNNVVGEIPKEIKDTQSYFIYSLITVFMGVLGLPGLVMGIIGIIWGIKMYKNSNQQLKILLSIFCCCGAIGISFMMGMTVLMLIIPFVLTWW